jgi:hypothetical protein
MAGTRCAGRRAPAICEPWPGSSPTRWQPVARSAGGANPTRPLLEAEDLVFSGTLCTSGEAEAQDLAPGHGQILHAYGRDT